MSISNLTTSGWVKYFLKNLNISTGEGCHLQKWNTDCSATAILSKTRKLESFLLLDKIKRRANTRETMLEDVSPNLKFPALVKSLSCYLETKYLLNPIRAQQLLTGVWGGWKGVEQHLTTFQFIVLTLGQADKLGLFILSKQRPSYSSNVMLVNLYFLFTGEKY